MSDSGRGDTDTPDESAYTDSTGKCLIVAEEIKKLLRKVITLTAQVSV